MSVVTGCDLSVTDMVTWALPRVDNILEDADVPSECPEDGTKYP